MPCYIDPVSQEVQEKMKRRIQTPNPQRGSLTNVMDVAIPSCVSAPYKSGSPPRPRIFEKPRFFWLRNGGTPHAVAFNP